MAISATATAAGEDPQLREATRIVLALQGRGFTAYFAGGCVRDQLLGIPPSDYDVATDATPEQIIQIFGQRNTLLVGAAFGVACVHTRIGGRRIQTEVATFRADGEYLDGRRPSSVRFAGIEEDARRRDFTINGMYYDPIARRLHDLVGGEADLRSGIVRAIGSAAQRIAEDKLRMIRAIRFAARFGFEIEPKTVDAISAAASTLGAVSGERIADELRKISADERVDWAVARLHEYRLLDTIWPELADFFDSDVNALTNSLRTIAAIDQRDLTAVLGAFTYLLHWRRGLAIDATIDGLLHRLKLSNLQTTQIAFAAASIDPLLAAVDLPWSQVQPLVASPHAGVALRIASAVASTYGLPTAGLDFVQTKYCLSRDLLNPPPLLGGDDLKRLGLPPGPAYKAILADLRALQLDGRLRTTTEAIEWVIHQGRDTTVGQEDAE